ncbi:MAG: DUF177 domain-containing protein [Candidatus Krumholzibacteria bacterium]|nr:DUF177 domain-containing protein [Candidatus Krumholzibacteria bacterium]
MGLDLGHSDDRETFTFEEEFPVRGPEGDDVPCRAAVTAESTRTGSSYLLEGRIEADISGDCSRCLKSFEFKLVAEFSMMLRRSGRVPEGSEEENFVLMSEAQEFDFDIFPVVREAVVLEMPIKYLCKESCAGICPRCGADLNEGACSCGEKSVDPRWGPLKKLLKEEDEK